MSNYINKQNFLKWLLTNFKHQDPTVNFLIDYMASNPQILERIRFSDAAKYAPRGLFISYKRFDQEPFIYYKDQHTYHQSEQAFHDIRLNERRLNEPIFIELDIPNRYSELYRFEVFEENPYINKEDQQLDHFEKIFEDYSQKGRLNYLTDRLNKSLEEHNFEASEYYLKQIQQLKGEKE